MSDDVEFLISGDVGMSSNGLVKLTIIGDETKTYTLNREQLYELELYIKTGINILNGGEDNDA